MPRWADQPGPGVWRLVGALSARGQGLIEVEPRSAGRVVVRFPYFLMMKAYEWPGHDFGGSPTGLCPPTRAAGIRVANELRACGPDVVRTWELVWRWERFEDDGPHRGVWVDGELGPVVRADASSAAPGQEARA